MDIFELVGAPLVGALYWVATFSILGTHKGSPYGDTKLLFYSLNFGTNWDRTKLTS